MNPVAVAVLSLLVVIPAMAFASSLVSRRRCPEPTFTAVEVATMHARLAATRRWFDADLARSLGFPVQPTYEPVHLRELVTRANRVPDWLAAGTMPPAHLPVSPDPRRKES